MKYLVINKQSNNQLTYRTVQNFQVVEFSSSKTSFKTFQDIKKSSHQETETSWHQDKIQENKKTKNISKKKESRPNWNNSKL